MHKSSADFAVGVVRAAIEQNKEVTGLQLVLTNPFYSLLVAEIGKSCKPVIDADALAVWANEAADAMRSRKAVSFDRLCTELGAILAFGSTQLCLVVEVANGIYEDATADLKDSPINSVAFGHADGRLEAVRRILEQVHTIASHTIAGDKR